MAFASPLTPSIALAALLGALSAGCNSASAEAKPDQASAPKVAATAPSAAKPLGQAPANYQESAFELSLSGPQASKVDESVEYVVVLKAKQGFKVNAEYPIKFAFEPSDQLVPEVPILTKAQATVEKMQVVLRGKVKASKPGASSVAGKLSFSVCTEEQCLIEKRDLSLPITTS